MHKAPHTVCRVMSFELLSPCQTAWWIEEEMNREKARGWISLRQSASCSNRQEINIYRHSPCFRQHSCQNEQTVLTAKVMSSLHIHTQAVYTLSLLLCPLHTETLRPETKAQVKVDKRCLWIFWVTHSNHCLHSSCNYLLTDLILAVKWLAKSMCTQTGPESKVVHAVYLLAPSHTWCTAIGSPDRKPLSLTLQELNCIIHARTQKNKRE